ncbi:MAG: hypothetical protein HUJ71_03735 [Pseudobutyrivibrio sp.]|nr:hypothetical protein [Pseudobutyrivibrio sp.]
MVESVKGSNAIEGIITTDDRIREIVNGSIPISHDEMEISGYKDALNLINTSYEDLDFTEDVILSFHKMLILMSNFKEAGKYKTRDKLPNVSIKTVELVLSRLVKKEKIVKIGTYKDARYMKNI